MVLNQSCIRKSRSSSGINRERHNQSFDSFVELTSHWGSRAGYLGYRQHCRW